MVSSQSWKELDGKWKDEPSFVESKSKGYHTVVSRNEEMGNLNGYVGVNIFHPAYGLHYDHSKLSKMYVHGGLTYSGSCEFLPKKKKGYWYFGFDTAHAQDEVPALLAFSQQLPEIGGMSIFGHSTYKDLSYVTDEVYNLLEQMKEIAQSRVIVNHKNIYRKLHKAKTASNNSNTFAWDA